MADKIELFDGEKMISYELLASFQVDDKNYCLLSNEGIEEFFSYEEDGDDIVFSGLDSEEEEAEVEEIYRELLEERYGK